MKNGLTVRAFEDAFARYVGADYAIAFCNGTATLATALRALGVTAGQRVQTTPLTMSATTLAILHAGGLPLYGDVDPDTWVADCPQGISVSLYGAPAGACAIDDAAQRLGPHNRDAHFTSYSFQASKHLSTGEGGMLTTNSRDLADAARSLGSLGYDLSADRPCIDPERIKAPDAVRHVRLGWNYRMSDAQAELGLRELERADDILTMRRKCASMYADAVAGCDWLTPQDFDRERGHACWAYAVELGHHSSLDTDPDTGGMYWGYPLSVETLQEAIVRHGGERPYGAWRLAYDEPALEGLRAVNAHGCPVAELLQPRLLQFQTNDTPSAERNASALRRAIREVGGLRG